MDEGRQEDTEKLARDQCPLQRSAKLESEPR